MRGPQGSVVKHMHWKRQERTLIIDTIGRQKLWMATALLHRALYDVDDPSKGINVYATLNGAATVGLIFLISEKKRMGDESNVKMRRNAEGWHKCQGTEYRQRSPKVPSDGTS